jgi:hypothetical protein
MMARIHGLSSTIWAIRISSIPFGIRNWHQVTKDLVDMLDEATEIVDFFKKQDEIKAVKLKIKRQLVETSFDDADLRKAVMDRFMELAKVKFGK